MQTVKKFLSIIAIVAAVVGVVYLGGIGYYADRFLLNTQYGPIDVSNMTLAEAKQEVRNQLAEQEITLVENGETIRQIQLSELNPNFLADDELEALYKRQNPNLWMANAFNVLVYASEDEALDLDTEHLTAELNASELNGQERIPAQDASLEYNEADGYYVEPGKKGTMIDSELLEDTVVDAVVNKSNQVDLSDAYQQPQVTEDSPVMEAITQRIEETVNSKITFQLSGEEIVIPREKIESWILFDANNEITFDREAINNYLYELNEEYGTFNKTREFQSTLQGTVSVPPGILGWGIDVEAETEQIVSDLYYRQDATRTPTLTSTGGIAGAEDDIGNTYVEVDLANQYMFLYVDNQLIVETPIVSGKLGAETVAGANAVNEMLTDTNLVGYNHLLDVEYSTPVSYWIRFDNQAQGIHDASWQGAFGGDVWAYSGSLGCINTPYDAVATIYQYVDYGTPVIVFY